MSLPQLIGLNCACCWKGIGSITDGEFCQACGNPVHRKCLDRPEPPAGRCPTCGGDPNSDIAKEVRRERGTVEQARALAQVRAGAVKFPVSNVCPKCASADFTRQRPQGWVSFAWDRVCKQCGTVYSPPTPLWAAVLFLIVGFLMAGFGVVEVVGSMALANPCTAPAAIFGAFIGALGVLAIIQGIRSLARPGKT